MQTQVVTCSDRQPEAEYYRFGTFKESLRRLGVEPVILGFGSKWRGLMSKPFLLRDWLRSDAPKSEFIIVCDAWDIVFQEAPDSIIERYKQLFPSLPVVLNAERGCWPLAELADKFIDPGTPWRYPNSGFQVGRPEHILAVIDHMKIDEIGVDRVEDGKTIEPNDQAFTTLAFLDQPVPMMLDTQAELCLACHGTTPEELQFSLSAQKVKNVVTGTFPGCFHFHGGSKQGCMEHVLGTLGLNGFH